MIGSVRVELGLHCECDAVSCEELETRLVVEYFHQSSRGRRIDISHKVHFSCSAVIQAEILVIAANHTFRDGCRSWRRGARGESSTCGRSGGGHLPFAQQYRLAEIECCALHGLDSSRWNESTVNLGDCVGINAEYMVLYVLCREAVEVEIYVVGKVADGGFVGSGRVLDLHAVILSYGEGEISLQGSGEAVKAVFQDAAHHHSIISYTFYVPNGMVKSLGSSVEGMLAVVLGYFVLDTINSERCVAYAVCISAKGSATRIAAETLVLLDIVVMANDVCIVPVLVRSVYAHDVTGIIGNLGSDPAICDSVKGNLFAVNFRVKVRFVQELRPSLCVSQNTAAECQKETYLFHI